ncbi:DUF2493 domain-containing protein [Robertmurraya siralis]|uniref:DUF2493 domain-containing protein n=1 Tax=Robertmurraya siralis TaxID=77777 RepID=UPI0010F6B39A|nr:DUF2493 domain-containing protein [Robertmurraya siralis]
MHKVIVAGSRGFNDYELLEQELHKFLSGKNIIETEIVSGTARGADQLGEKLAKEYNLKLTRMAADWETYGKSAGYRRNAEMAKYADACIVFWDGASKGTKHMIDLAKREGLDLKIVEY